MKMVVSIIGGAAAALLVAHDAVSLIRNWKLEKENELLEELVLRQSQVTDTMLSSLESCRENIDSMTEYSQAVAMETLSERSQLELARRRSKKKQKKPFKPFYILVAQDPKPNPPDLPAMQ